MFTVQQYSRLWLELLRSHYHSSLMSTSWQGWERILSLVNNPTFTSIPCIFSRLSDVLNLFTFLNLCKQYIGKKFMDVVQHRQSTHHSACIYTITCDQIPNCVYRHMLIIGLGIYHSPQWLLSSPTSWQQCHRSDSGKTSAGGHTIKKWTIEPHQSLPPLSFRADSSASASTYLQAAWKVEEKVELNSQKVCVSVDQDLHDELKENETRMNAEREWEYSPACAT